MVIIINGVLGGADLSGYLDRQAPFTVEASTGSRMDTLRMTLFDKSQQLVIPQKSEIIIYDILASSLPPGWVGFSGLSVVDPPASNSTPLGYTYGGSYTYDGVAKYDTEPPLSGLQNPTTWTPRLFGGYIATAEYMVTSGLEREIVISAQDYTSRVNFTICNRAYAPDGLHPLGWSDDQVVRDLFNAYAPDIDTTFVSSLMPAGSMPPISFPTHTLAQMMQRIIKVSQGYFRVDYYKRLYYGAVGYQQAPFNINADAPNNMTGPSPTCGAEGLQYSPDASNLIDRVWVVGGTYVGPQQTYTFPTTLWDGVANSAVLPDKLHNARSVAISINGVDQGTVGVLGVDGQLDNRPSWPLTVLVGVNPPTVAFQTPPPANATILVVGIFTYPLIQVVTDSATLATLGIPWEKVIKDSRVDTVLQAQQIGQGYLALQKSAKPAGQCVIYDHIYNGQVLQPGQSITITSTACFGGGVLGSSTVTLNAYITKLTTELTQNQSHQYKVTVSFSDRPDIADSDLMDQMLGEQARVNAALTQTDVYSIVEDAQTISGETVTMGTESLTVTVLGAGGTYKYDGTNVDWDYAKWG